MFKESGLRQITWDETIPCSANLRMSQRHGKIWPSRGKLSMYPCVQTNTVTHGCEEAALGLQQLLLWVDLR